MRPVAMLLATIKFHTVHINWKKGLQYTASYLKITDFTLYHLHLESQLGLQMQMG